MATGTPLPVENGPRISAPQPRPRLPPRRHGGRLRAEEPMRLGGERGQEARSVDRLRHAMSVLGFRLVP